MHERSKRNARGTGSDIRTLSFHGNKKRKGGTSSGGLCDMDTLGGKTVSCTKYQQSHNITNIVGHKSITKHMEPGISYLPEHARMVLLKLHVQETFQKHHRNLFVAIIFQLNRRKAVRISRNHSLGGDLQCLMVPSLSSSGPCGPRWDPGRR